MKEGKKTFPDLTDEESAEFDELWEKYTVGAEEHSLVTLSVHKAVIREWLLNKYRAYYDLTAFIGIRTDKNFSPEKGLDREVFAGALTIYAMGYMEKRLDAILNSSIQGLVTEIHEAQRLIVEGGLRLKGQDELYPHLLSGKRMDAIWLNVIRDHLDPRFVRGRGGKQAIANLKLLYEKYEDIVGDWVEASEIFQSASKSRSYLRRNEWRNEVQRIFSSLPEDLIERLQPQPNWPKWIADICEKKGGEDKPGDIALEHAARLCGAESYVYKLSSLRENYNKQKRKKFEKNV